MSTASAAVRPRTPNVGRRRDDMLSAGGQMSHSALGTERPTTGRKRSFSGSQALRPHTVPNLPKQTPRTRLSNEVNTKIRQIEATNSLEKDLEKRESLVLEINQLSQKKQQLSQMTATSLQDSMEATSSDLEAEISRRIESLEIGIDFQNDKIKNAQAELLRLREPEEHSRIDLDALSPAETTVLLRESMAMLLEQKQRNKQFELAGEKLREELKDSEDKYQDAQLANAEFNRRLLSLQKEHEYQKLVLLKQIQIPDNGVGANTDVSSLLRSKQEHIDLLDHQREQVLNENHELKTELTDVKSELERLKLEVQRLQQKEVTSPPVPEIGFSTRRSLDKDSDFAATSSSNSGSWSSSTVSKLKIKLGLSTSERKIKTPSTPRSAAVATPQKISSFRCANTLRGHEGFVLALALATNSNSLFSAGQDKIVKNWDLETTQEVQALSGHQKEVLNIQTDGKILVTGSRDRSIKIWTTDTGACIKTIQFGADINSLVIDSANNRLFCGLDGAVKVMDLNNFKMVRSIPSHHKGTIFALHVTDKFLFTGGRDHSINTFTLNNLEFYQKLHPPHYDGVNCFAMVNGKSLLSGSRDKTMKLWDLSQDEIVQTKVIQGSFRDWVTSFAMDAASSATPVLFSSCRDGSIAAWDIETLNTIEAFTAHNSSVNALVSSARNGKSFVYSASNDRTVKVWRWKRDASATSEETESDVLDGS
eukprot:TRINITY_DN1148_c0_g1_i1.p1 TRINITY_DN1148_c0_g1~~TRINITY_DN1148_c0_g1_i1.p1  ORF type:complete len:804 (+),score=254.74 TRINITY_DN1148_c0_g1_i1:293-2413(+)